MASTATIPWPLSIRMLLLLLPLWRVRVRVNPFTLTLNPKPTAYRRVGMMFTPDCFFHPISSSRQTFELEPTAQFRPLLGNNNSLKWLQPKSTFFFFMMFGNTSHLLDHCWQRIDELITWNQTWSHTWNRTCLENPGTEGSPQSLMSSWWTRPDGSVYADLYTSHVLQMLLLTKKIIESS